MLSNVKACTDLRKWRPRVRYIGNGDANLVHKRAYPTDGMIGMGYALLYIKRPSFECLKGDLTPQNLLGDQAFLKV